MTDAALHSALWRVRRGDAMNAWYDVRVGSAGESGSFGRDRRPAAPRSLEASAGGPRVRAAGRLANGPLPSSLPRNRRAVMTPRCGSREGECHARIGRSRRPPSERSSGRLICNLRTRRRGSRGDGTSSSAGPWNRRMRISDAAAALTPDELHRFLEAGWWVLGADPPTLPATALIDTVPRPESSSARACNTDRRTALAAHLAATDPRPVGGVTFGVSPAQATTHRVGDNLRLRT